MVLRSARQKLQKPTNELFDCSIHFAEHSIVFFALQNSTFWLIRTLFDECDIEHTDIGEAGSQVDVSLTGDGRSLLHAGVYLCHFLIRPLISQTA